MSNLDVAGEARSVMIFGAHTRLGQAICSLLMQAGYDPICMTYDLMLPNPTDSVYKACANKKPAVIINCLVDPDSGEFPTTDPVFFYAAPTQAMVQQATALGSIYIHCSSSRIYGQPDNRRPKRPYEPYDTAVSGDDPWSRILIELERTVAMFANRYTPLRLRSNRVSTTYVLRFGHLLHDLAYEGKPASILTLDRALRLSVASDRTFAVESTLQMLSVLTTSAAADCVLQCITESYRLIAGYYNIGSEPVTVSQLFCTASLMSNKATKLVSTSEAGITYPTIMGLSTYTGVSSREWLDQGMRFDTQWRKSLQRMYRSLTRVESPKPLAARPVLVK